MKVATMMLGAAGLALAAGLVTVAGQHVGHEGHGPHGGPDGPMMMPQMVEWLVDNALENVNATDAQRAKVLAVKDRVLSQAQALHGAHDATHAEFKKEWDLDRMDAGRLHSLVDARMDELRKVLHTAVDGIVEVHDTLTPEQRRTLTARVEAMHGSD